MTYWVIERRLIRSHGSKLNCAGLLGCRRWSALWTLMQNGILTVKNFTDNFRFPHSRRCLNKDSPIRLTIWFLFSSQWFAETVAAVLTLWTKAAVCCCSQEQAASYCSIFVKNIILNFCLVHPQLNHSQMHKKRFLSLFNCTLKL